MRPLLEVSSLPFVAWPLQRTKKIYKTLNNRILNHFSAVRLSRPKTFFHAQKWPFTFFSRSFTFFSRCCSWQNAALIPISSSWTILQRHQGILKLFARPEIEFRSGNRETNPKSFQVQSFDSLFLNQVLHVDILLAIREPDNLVLPVDRLTSFGLGLANIIADKLGKTSCQPSEKKTSIRFKILYHKNVWQPPKGQLLLKRTTCRSRACRKLAKDHEYIQWRNHTDCRITLPKKKCGCCTIPNNPQTDS